MTPRLAAVVLVLLSLMGCGESGPSAEELSALAEPHLAHFDSFDRWARRAVDADPAFHSRDALSETVFAPLRRERDVWGAWASRGNGGRALAFGHIREVPKALQWFPLRHQDMGELQVTTAKFADPRGPARAEAQPCVLIRRIRPGPDGAQVSVTLAYRHPDSASSGSTDPD